MNGRENDLFLTERFKNFFVVYLGHPHFFQTGVNQIIIFEKQYYGYCMISDRQYLYFYWTSEI